MTEATLAKAIVQGLMPYLVGTRNETEELGTKLVALIDEVKKKSEFVTEIEIDDDLKEELKGKDGYTPIKGKDYFSPAEVQEMIDKIISIVTPVVGQDYYTEEEKQALIEQVKASIEIPPPVKGDDGATPEKGVDYFTQEEIDAISEDIISKVTVVLAEGNKIRGKDIIDELRRLPKQNALQIKDIYGLQKILEALDRKAGERGSTGAKGEDGTGGGPGGSVSWGDIIGTLSAQTDLQAALDGKQPVDADLSAIAALSPSNDDIIQRKAGNWVSRTIAQLKFDLGLTKSDVGLANVDNTSDLNKPISTATQTALDLKQNLSGKDVANGYAGLDAGGKINPSQLPSIAVTDTFVVASQVAMLALSAQTGDIAIRTDESKTYILQGSNPATLGDWVLFQTPTDAVSSVFGRTGPVTAQSGDYTTAQVTESGNLYFTTGRVLATALAGFSVSGTRTAIVAADTVLQAFGKVQKYFNDLSALAFSGSASDLSGTKTSSFISDFASAVAALITGKQDTLVSGTNLKTVGGNSLLGAGDIPLTGGLSDGAISFNLFRSSGLVIGDGFKAIVPFGATIIGWSIATKDGTAGTVTLDVKKAAYSGVPTFSQIDGTDPILLSGASKNTSVALTGWTTSITEDDHLEITVASVTGTVTGVYGIIKVSKTS